MLYQVLKRIAERGKMEGLHEKLDVFFAMNRLTQAEYDELCRMLNPQR